MYCSTCGAAIPANRRTCDTCGAVPVRMERADPETAGWPGRPAALPAGGVLACPRCAYRGQGLPYFSRGSHVAALVGATIFTLGFMGAGGVAYYLMRRDHRVCPRCGRGWGRHGERAALVETMEPRPVVEAEVPAGRGSARGALAILAYLLAAILVVAGVAEQELVAVVFGVMAGAGGFALRRGALREREERRAELLASLQQPVLRLAARRAGVLTVTEVAAELGWPMRRAEKVLQSMDDGYRVSSEVTDEGLLVYEFLELRRIGERNPPTELDPPLA